MGVFTFTDSITSPVPAPKLFRALVTDAHNLVPKIVPQAIKSIDIIQGNGGPGSIKQVTFGEASPLKYVKHKIDVLDEANLTYADTVIEGGELSDKVESITHEVKFESSSNGGTIANNVVKFHTKAGAEVTEEQIKPGKEAAHAVFKAVEAYLLANPNAA